MTHNFAYVMFILISAQHSSAQLIHTPHTNTHLFRIVQYTKEREMFIIPFVLSAKVKCNGVKNKEKRNNSRIEKFSFIFFYYYYFSLNLSTL